MAPFFIAMKRPKPKAACQSALSQRRSKRRRQSRRGSDRPIALYYWPTPNGWKISIMLEECGLPYIVHPVDISKGEQFAPAFLAISPNNRMPAIVDPDGPGGRPISVFESGAILQYLGRKTGKFYPRDERARTSRSKNGCSGRWAGSARWPGRPSTSAATRRSRSAYAVARYSDEVNRLYGVMNTRLAQREFLAGRYSIADMACVGWVRLAERQGQDLGQFPDLKRWFETIRARPAVKRAFAIRIEAASHVDANDPKVRAVLFGQRAR